MKKETVLSIIGVLLLIIITISISFAVYSFSEGGTKDNVIVTGTITFTYTENTNGIYLSNAIPMTDNEGKLLSGTQVNVTPHCEIDGVDNNLYTLENDCLEQEGGAWITTTGLPNTFDFTISGNTNAALTINYEIFMTLNGSCSDSSFLTQDTCVQGEESWVSATTIDTNYIKVYLTDGSDVAMTGYTADVPTYNDLVTSTSDIYSKRLYAGSFSNATSLNQNFRLRIWIDQNYSLNDVSKIFTAKVNVKAVS